VRALGSLRGRVAVLATIAVAGVLLAVGATSVASFSEREHARVDDALEARPVGALVRALRGPPGPGELEPAPPDGPAPLPLGPEALRPEGEYIRLIGDGEVVRSVDAARGLPVPEEPGLRTLHTDGERYRSLTREAPRGLLLEVGTDLGPAEDRVAALRTRLLVLGALGVALVGAVSWWLAGLALQPLRALRDAAGRVSTTRDLSTRLPAEGSPEEVSELTASINSMLGRLERSAGETEAALEATRRFAGDAGHELRTPMTALRANLGALRRNPGLDPAGRRALLEDAEREAERAARLLEVLQTLARGDAAAALPRESVDLAGLAEAAVEAARSRHTKVSWHLEAPAEELELAGWPDGLRALIDNLLENAARHGRPGGEVRAKLGRDDSALVLTVDDDGPGVEASERERIFERFARGDEADSEGYGLGLALVRQQARLHGGKVSVSDSSLGGARFRVTLAATRSDGAGRLQTPRSAS
jgi:two-component system, OmpR family, sensor histidine kinase PrrB